MLSLKIFDRKNQLDGVREAATVEPSTTQRRAIMTNWTIVNNAAIGRGYGSYKTREQAVEAARARNQYKMLVIDDERRIVYFRQEIGGF